MSAFRLLFLALFFVSASATAATHAEAMQACQSMVTSHLSGPCNPGWVRQQAECRTNQYHAELGRVEFWASACTVSGAPLSLQTYINYLGQQEQCDEGYEGDAEFAFAGGDPPTQICVNECLADFDMDMCGSGGDNEGWCRGSYTLTGSECDGDLEPPDDCVDLGQGFRICKDDPPGCMQTPSGTLCPDFDTPECEENGQHVVCSGGADVPPDYTEGPSGETCSGWECTPLTGGFFDQDQDGESDDDDNDDDNDDVDDDEDNEEDEITANLPGCGETEPTCSDPDNVECRHYVVSWRHRCDGVGNKAGDGATCDAPPTCTHFDPVQCAQLKQLWRIRCDHDGNIKGGLSCSQEVTCTGVSDAACLAAKQLKEIKCGINPVVTGGNDCTAPFQCNPALATCRALMIQRETMCATKDQKESIDGVKDAVDGAKDDMAGMLGSGNSTGECTEPPTCSAGAGIGCALLRQQWRTMCATREGGGVGEAITNAFAPVDDTPSASPDGPTVLYEAEDDEDPGIFDGGWEPRGSCPVEIGFHSYRLGAFTVPNHNLCMFLDALANLVLLAGALTSMFIAFGGRK